MTTKNKKQQDLGLTIPKNIEDIIVSSGVEITKAQNIALNYVPFTIHIQEQIDIVNSLKKGEIGDVEKARRSKLDIGKIVSKMKDQKAKDKENLLVETKFIDKLYNTNEGAAREIQNTAKEIEDHFENIERERLAKLKANRLELLANFEVDNLDSFNVEVMSEDAFNIFLKGCEQSYLSKKAEELRLQKEADEKQKITDLHNARKESLLDFWSFVSNEDKELNFGTMEEKDFNSVLSAAKTKKTENDALLEKQRLENERLRAEAEAKQKIADDLKKEADRVAAENAAKLKAEQDKLTKIEAEVKAKKQKVLDEQARIEKEKAELLKQGDKAILLNYISNFTTPSIDASFKNANSILKLKEINAKFEGFKNWASGEVEKL